MLMTFISLLIAVHHSKSGQSFSIFRHDSLIFKLKQNGVSGPVLNLLTNYLQNRKQRVVLNGSSSNYFPTESGVPQGSVLGPLLFLIYINDLEKNIKSKIKFFADDTMIFSVVQGTALTASVLNHDLELINMWAYQWKMAFNPEPNKQAVEVLISQKRLDSNHPPLFFNRSMVLKVDAHKHLGLILDSKLLFVNHINEKIKLAKKGIGVLKYLSQYLALKTLDQMYKMFVRPIFDYCDVIYHSPHLTNPFDSMIKLNPLMERIEKIQYQAALAITGGWQGSSRIKLYEELGWESLSDRRWQRRLIQLFKIRNNMTPAYLRGNILRQRSLLFGNCNPNIYHEIFCNTARYMNSFFPDAIKIWNNIHNCTPLSIFKRNIPNLIHPASKTVFGIHDPIGLKRLFQLRVQLSNLKSHKRRHNFSDTPSHWCDCNCGPEDTKHFLLKCIWSPFNKAH